MMVPEYLVCVFQVVFVRKLLVLVVSVWFPPVTSMTTRALSLAFIVLFSLVLHCVLFYVTSADCSNMNDSAKLAARVIGD